MASVLSGRNIVSYHYPCPDGVFAALAAHLHFQQQGIGRVQWVPNRVFDPCTLQDLNLQKDDTLYMLDYIGPSNFAADAAKVAGRVVLLDHHKTAMEAYQNCKGLAPNLEVNLDMQQSGATIALQYFSPKVSEDTRNLFKFIEDADLWRWDVKDSKFFHTGLGSMGLEYNVKKNPSIFEQLLKLQANAVIAKGRKEQNAQDTAIAAAVKASLPAHILKDGEKLQECLAYEVPLHSDLGSLRSQLGNALAQQAAENGRPAVGLVAYHEAEMKDPSKIKCSLRSIGNVDTSAISKQFGGGGHRNASSFITDTADFLSWIRNS